MNKVYCSVTDRYVVTLSTRMQRDLVDAAHSAKATDSRESDQLKSVTGRRDFLLGDSYMLLLLRVPLPKLQWIADW